LSNKELHRMEDLARRIGEVAADWSVDMKGGLHE
jgi:hypothetical protein